MKRTAIDIVIELIRTGSIPNDDAKLLLEAINKPPQTVTVPYITGTITNKPDWIYDTHTSGYSQAEGTTDNQPKTTLTTNG